MKKTGLIILVAGLAVSVQLGRADWTTSQRLTWTPGMSDRPVIAIDASGYLHVVWEDSSPGNFEIYYKKGT